MFHLTGIWNVRLGNTLDVDLKMITKCPMPPKDNGKRRKQVSFNEKGNRACNNGKNKSDQKIYSYIARMSGNDKCTSGNFGDSLQLTSWIWDSGATCQMKS